MAAEIDPLWLQAGPLTQGVQHHVIAPLLRLPLRLRGRAHVLVLAAQGDLAAQDDLAAQHDPAPPDDPVRIAVLSASGQILHEAQALAPACAVFLPKGAARIAVFGPRRFRLGLYPRSKLSLKLHAFTSGHFPDRPLHRRWRDAAAAARDLRGVHASLLETSQARRAEHAVRYRRLRAAFTGDFRAIVPPRTDLRLTFVSHLPAGLTRASADAAWQALRAQSDGEWAWVLVLSPDTPADVAAWTEGIAGQDPRCRLVRVPSPPGPGALLAHAAELPDDGRPSVQSHKNKGIEGISETGHENPISTPREGKAAADSSFLRENKVIESLPQTGKTESGGTSLPPEGIARAAQALPEDQRPEPCSRSRNTPVAELPLNGILMPDAVAMVRAAFQHHPDCQLVYTDEEACDAAGQPQEGLFKPAYNRHLLRGLDYLGHLVAVRGQALRQALERHRAADHSRHALRLALCETLPPAAIRHVPRVAFSAPERAPAPAGSDDANAVAQVLGVAMSVTGQGFLHAHYPVPDPAPLVSVVIPTRDRADLMGQALRSLIEKTRYRNFEIVIVDNGSVEPKTFALFEEIKAAWPRTRIVRDDGDFNYPRICNAGVDVASGSLICLLNNDIEVVDGAWLDEMVSLAALPGTGIVGAKLLFPDRTLQHAGVIVGLFRYAAHWFTHGAPDMPGPFGRLAVRSNVSAVTGACLLISRACWDAVGPLDAVRFAEDCNDIDLCLRARAGGFEVVWTPFACLIHHESASRGRRRSRAHRNRLKAQRARMEARWHTSVLVDPHYNPNQSRTSLHAGVARQPEGPRDPRTDAIDPPSPDA